MPLAAASRPVAAASTSRYRLDLFKRFMTLLLTSCSERRCPQTPPGGGAAVFSICACRLPAPAARCGAHEAVTSHLCAAAATAVVRLLRGGVSHGASGLTQSGIAQTRIDNIPKHSGNFRRTLPRRLATGQCLARRSEIRLCMGFAESRGRDRGDRTIDAERWHRQQRIDLRDRQRGHWAESTGASARVLPTRAQRATPTTRRRDSGERLSHNGFSVRDSICCPGGRRRCRSTNIMPVRYSSKLVNVFREDRDEFAERTGCAGSNT